jgi:microcystin-dependent protein
MDEFLGTIKLFGFNFAPKGWAFCQGQLMSISQNTALFSLLGTYYGGNGQTTFALPDLRSRVAVGQGQGPGLSQYDMGQQGGMETVTLIANQMPVHTHAATATTTAVMTAEMSQASATNPNDRCLASGTQIYADNDPNQNRGMSPHCITATTTVTIANAGGSQPVGIITPYLALNYCICTQGIYPSRN